MTIGSMEKVEVFISEGKGRGLKTTKELWAADVVFAERAYSAVVFDSFTHVVCHTCFKRQEKLQRCGQCKFAHYCDRTCQKDAWLNHKNECAAIKKHGKPPSENIRLAARIMWRIEREGTGLTEGCLVSVDDLQNHVDNFGEEEQKDLRMDVDSFLNFWPPQSQQFSMQYISHIFGVINCNAFTLSDQRGLQAVGVGIFPNLCLVNHDCWPNCTVIFNNGKKSTPSTPTFPKPLTTRANLLRGVPLNVNDRLKYSNQGGVLPDSLVLSGDNPKLRILKEKNVFNLSKVS